MCCSTGVCGPEVDPKLVRFAADLKWLAEQGVTVERFNLAQTPIAFAENEVVRTALTDKGEAALPLVLVEGKVAVSGSYPTREELAGWLGLKAGCCGSDDKDSPGTLPRRILQQPASDCESGCDCHAPGASGKTRWVLGAIVLVAAGALVVRALIKGNGASAQASARTFVAAPVAQAPAPALKGSSPLAQTTALESNLGASPGTAGTGIGTPIAAFSELDTVAANTDAVFIFLPGKDGAAPNPPSTTMLGAARTLESKGIKCGLFILKAGSPDYGRMASQVSVPGVLAMVKGHGMNAISGEITETKLVQGFVAASRAGGCGPASGGCGPSGCK